MTPGSGKLTPIALLRALIDEDTCVHCLEPLRSQLHHELCEVISGQPQQQAPAKRAA